MRYPQARWVPSPHFGYPTGRRGQLVKPEAFVYHIMSGTLTGCDAWFNNPASQASAHFGIGKLGPVHQYVELTDAPYANGKIQKPDLTIPWLKKCVVDDINPNTVTVSIEHEGKTGEVWTEAMYQASKALTVWLLDYYDLWAYVDDFNNRFIGHYKIDSVDRPNCPGTGWPKTRLKTDLIAMKEDEMMTDQQIAEAIGRIARAGQLGLDKGIVGTEKLLDLIASLKSDIAALKASGGTVPHKHSLSATITGETEVA